MEQLPGSISLQGPARDTSSRFGAAQCFGSSFPCGTLIVNLLGCLGVAAVMHMALTLSWPPTLSLSHHESDSSVS
jgi:fluoride ion exporter CrcB/FEX